MPDPFDDVIGHGSAVQLLRREISGGRLPHAILFAGAPGIGKTTLARRLAAALLPEAPLERHPDFWLDDEERALPIDAVRGGPGWTPDPARTIQSDPLQPFLNTRPLTGGRRVAVVARAQRIELEAANSLLKTLEEPPLGAVIVLTAENPGMLPPTVMSRCQVMQLEPVAPEAMAAALRRRGVGDDQADRIAASADGAPGLALTRAADPGSLRALDEAIDRLRGARGATRAQILDLAETIGESGAIDSGERRQQREDLLLVTAAWLSWLRDLMAVSAGAEDRVINRHRLAEVRHEAAGQPAGEWARLVEDCVLLRSMIRRYVPPRLALERFLLSAFAPTAEARPGALERAR